MRFRTTNTSWAWQVRNNSAFTVTDDQTRTPPPGGPEPQPAPEPTEPPLEQDPEDDPNTAPEPPTQGDDE
jgi:hypothetical protein